MWKTGLTKNVGPVFFDWIGEKVEFEEKERIVRKGNEKMNKKHELSEFFGVGSMIEGGILPNKELTKYG